MSDTRLFQDIVGVIPDGIVLEHGAAVQGDTPFIAFGLYVKGPELSRKPCFIGYIPGGKVVSVEAQYVRVQLSPDQKKALAEVVMTT